MQILNKKEFKKDVEGYVKLLFRKNLQEADKQQIFQGVAYSVKNIIIENWMATHKAYEEKHVKTVYYLSMEF